jgi:hypothetical protein
VAPAYRWRSLKLNGAPHRKPSEGLVRGVRGTLQEFLS